MLRSIALLEVAIKVLILVANPDITDLSSVYTEMDCDNHWYADDSTAVSPAVSAVPFTDDSLRPFRVEYSRTTQRRDLNDYAEPESASPRYAVPESVRL